MESHRLGSSVPAAQNVTVDEVISAYKQACQKLSCRQIPKLLRQLQVCRQGRGSPPPSSLRGCCPSRPGGEGAHSTPTARPAHPAKGPCTHRCLGKSSVSCECNQAPHEYLNSIDSCKVRILNITPQKVLFPRQKAKYTIFLEA